MKQRCVSCGHQWDGCPNCNNPDPDKEKDYSPQDNMLSEMAKTATRISLNNNPVEDNSSKYNNR